MVVPLLSPIDIARNRKVGFHVLFHFIPAIQGCENTLLLDDFGSANALFVALHYRHEPSQCSHDNVQNPENSTPLNKIKGSM